MGGDHRPKELGGNVRQGMGLVDHHGLHRGQKVAAALLPKRHVGAEQVMVHHNEVCSRRLFSGLDDVAGPNAGAVLAQAILGARGHQGPDARGLRNPFTARNVAVGGDLRELLHGAQCLRIARRGQARIGLGQSQPVHAQIVRAAFEPCHLKIGPQQLAQSRNVAVEELVL